MEKLFYNSKFSDKAFTTLEKVKQSAVDVMDDWFEEAMYMCEPEADVQSQFSEVEHMIEQWDGVGVLVLTKPECADSGSDDGGDGWMHTDMVLGTLTIE